MQELAVLNGLFNLLIGIINLVILIVFIVMAGNISKIRKQGDNFMRVAALLVKDKTIQKKYCTACKEYLSNVFSYCPTCGSPDIATADSCFRLRNKKNPKDELILPKATVNQYRDYYEKDYNISNLI